MAKRKGKAGLTKAQLRQYNKLVKQTSRARSEIKAANKGLNYGASKGKVNKNRKVRGENYGKITEANRELIEFRKKHGIGKEPDKKKVRKRNSNKATEIELRTLTVWEFERSYLTGYITGNQFKYIEINGVRTKLKGEAPSKILSLYDHARNLAYLKTFATTPLVNVTLDYGTKTIIIEFLS